MKLNALRRNATMWLASGAVFIASCATVASAASDPMINPQTGQPYPRGTASYVPPGTAVNPGPMTQADVNAISDSSARATAQWQFNQAKAWPTQSDGIERGTDVNAQGKPRQYFTPQKLTAADCLTGRHWELIGGYAGCVCDGDTTHTRVSNDQPAACTAVPPPPPVVTTSWENQSFPCPAPATGTIFQTRQVTTTNGVSTYGAWTASGDTCSIPPPPPPPPPAITYGAENQNLACPSPLVGTGIIQTRQITYTNGVLTEYGPWTIISNDCSTPQTLPPPDPMVVVGVTVCGWYTVTAVVPQSQVAAWYAANNPWALLSQPPFDGSCGVGL